MSINIQPERKRIGESARGQRYGDESNIDAITRSINSIDRRLRSVETITKSVGQYNLNDLAERDAQDREMAEEYALMMGYD